MVQCQYLCCKQIARLLLKVSDCTLLLQSKKKKKKVREFRKDCNNLIFLSEKVQMIMKQHGKIQGILYLLLLSLSAHITKQLGMAPGGEFRTAFSEVSLYISEFWLGFIKENNDNNG